MSPTQAGHLVGVLVGSYSVPEWSEVAIRAFVSGIEDLDYEPACVAVDRWRKTRRERPTIADIREEALKAVGEAPLDVDEAFDVVMGWVRRVGRYGRPPGTPAAVALTVERMGWRTICDATSPETLRAQFERFYRAVAGRVRSDALAGAGLEPTRRSDAVASLVARRAAHKELEAGGGTK